jgi:intein/homing endonuclease
MRIPVARHIDNTFIKNKIKIGDKKYKLDYLFGWFIGAYLAEGNIANNTICITNISQHFIDNTKLFAQLFNKSARDVHYRGQYGPGVTTKFYHKELAQIMLKTMGTGSFVKRVPDFAFTAPNEFKAGLIQAYFDGDGNFQSDKTRNQIRVCSRSEQLITDIAMLLTYFDIFGSVKTQMVKDMPIYNLSMSARYGPLYKEHIGTLLHEEKLNKIIEYTERADIHNLSDDIDKINGLGELIAYCGKTLNLPGQSRNYGRWKKKESIGRRTLEKYMETFENHPDAKLIENELTLLRQARDSGVIWDEIVDIETYTPDQTDYVYDFTVPGNQTFMVDNGILVHNTLNTKHFAGVASKGSANSGVPRIKEIMSYSKSIKTPQTIVYFDDKYNTSKSDTNLIASYFKHLTIRELIEGAEIYYSMDGKDDLSKQLEDDNVTNPFYVNNAKDSIKSLPFVIRLKMNLEKMMDKETTLLDIKTKFITYWYKNFSNLKTVKKQYKDILLNVDKLAILSNNDNIIHIRFRLNDFNYTMLTTFLNIILDVITLKGIDNIANVHQAQERRMKANEHGDMVVEKEYVAFTDGINLEGLKMLKGINHSRTRINDIETVYKNYGIEAARNIIINELINTYEAGGGGSINHAHISLLVDTMTYSGEVVSIDRHGMNKVDNDPISKASFENTMDHFINAAIFSETDKLKSVSSRIAVGRVMNGGTGAFDLILDTEKLRNSEYIENETGGRTSFIPLTIEPLFGDIIEHGFARNDFFLPN